ncbi:MAG: hypothetical protein RMX65_004845 [Nostoc sp. DedQUE01]
MAIIEVPDTKFLVILNDNSDYTLNGEADNDYLMGQGGNNKLYGNSGDDTLEGGDGNDYLSGGVGNDIINGGNGFDTAFYTGQVTDYLVSFTSNGKVQVIDTVTGNGNEGTDILSGVEQINFAGNGVTRIVTGTAANDNLTNDIYWSMMFGGDGDDTITAAYGNDTLVGGNGRDSLNGGAGYDTAVYTGQVTDYAVSFLSDGEVQVIDTVSGNGNEGIDTLSGVEQINFAGNGVTRIVTGNGGNDNLINDKYWSMMYGGDGNDTLTAAYGNDTLVGGNGNDVLTGGTGADKFVFNSVSQGIDVIKDFRSKEDAIIIDSRFGVISSTQFSFDPSNGALSFNGQQFATLENATNFTIFIDLRIV